MASVRQLKTVWQLRFKDSQRIPDETTLSVSRTAYQTKTAAKRYADHLEHRYRDPSDPFDPWRMVAPAESGSAPTLFEAAEEYVAYKKDLGEDDKEGGWNTHTYAGTAPVILSFAKRTGGMAKSLRTVDVEAYVYRPGLAYGAKRSYRRMIGAFLTWMNEKGYNEQVERPVPLKTRKKLPEYCTLQELQKICTAHKAICRGKAKYAVRTSRAYYSDVWWICFYQGFRREELPHIRRKDVDFERGLIRVGSDSWSPKMGKDRVIPLTNPARPFFEAYAVGRAPDERLFDRKTGRCFSDAFREARREAFPDRTKITMHRLRNSAAIFWLQQKKPLIWIRDLMGHSSVQMLERYLRALGRSLNV